MTSSTAEICGVFNIKTAIFIQPVKAMPAFFVSWELTLKQYQTQKIHQFQHKIPIKLENK